MHKGNYVRHKTVHIVLLLNVYCNGYIEINKGYVENRRRLIHEYYTGK